MYLYDSICSGDSADITEVLSSIRQHKSIIGLSAIHDVPCPLSDSMQAQTLSIEYYHYIMDLLQDIISTFFFLWTEIRNYFQAALEQGSQICDIITR